MSGRVETVATGSFSMDYLRFGQGDQTLVVLPGASVQSVMGLADAVEEAYRLLENDFTIYLFDRRNDMPDPYPVSRMAQDTREAIRALGLDRVNMFGVSLGGMVALQIAVREPALVRKLALGSTTARVTDAHYRLLGRWTELAEQGKAEELYLAFAEMVYPHSMFDQLRGQLVETAKTVTSDDLARFTAVMRGIRGFDVVDDLQDIACPVLAIGSSDDRIFGADTTLQIAERLGARDDFEMHLYDGYGHASYDIAPDYKQRLLRFFM